MQIWWSLRIIIKSVHNHIRLFLHHASILLTAIMDKNPISNNTTSTLRPLYVAVACLAAVCFLLLGTVCWLAIENLDHRSSIRVLHDSTAKLTEFNAVLTEEVNALKDWKSTHYAESRKPVLVETLKKDKLHKTAESSRQKREILSSQGHSLTELVNAVQGLRGPPGSPGAPGKDGEDGADGRDAVNFDAVDRHINVTIKLVVDQEMSKVRLAANEIPQVAGAVYTRWGRTACPSTSDLVTKGIAAGTYYANKGGAAEYICLPDDPDLASNSLPLHYAKISGVEYHDLVSPLTRLGNDNAPCSICQTKGRSVQKMFAAKSRCPDSTWTVEYVGFLMSDHDSHHRTSYVCVDTSPEAIPGEARDTNGAIWHHIVTDCNGGQGTLGACPPYNSNSVLGCVVCSK